MDRSDLEGALQAISKARAGLADEESPKCLFPVRLGPEEWSLPEECGGDAVRGSHSIQEAGPLMEIASSSGRGLYVLALFPNVSHLTGLTRGAAGRPGTRWPWDIESVPPRRVSTGQASVDHVACSPDDQGYLAGADNLTIPDLGGRSVFCDNSPPPGMGRFLDALSVLSYRTLLFRVSQLRGVQRTALKSLSEQVDANNRFGIQMCSDLFKENGRVLTEVCRQKSGFDRRILGQESAMRLVHHVVEFEPIVRYALSEFFLLEYRNGNRKRSVWASLNVLPIGGRTWFILSHPCVPHSHVLGISKEVAYRVTKDYRWRKHHDLDAFVNSTNLYVSPVDYAALPKSDRRSVARGVALQISEEPFDKALEYLRSSSAGQALVSRCERKLRGKS